MTRQTQIAYIKDLIPLDFCKFFTHVMQRKKEYLDEKDSQVPTAISIIHHEYMFETVHEIIWDKIETAIGQELIPTYAYARLYQNGDVLEKHVDRPACEVSVTVQLGRSHNYSWPIYMGGTPVYMAEGDGVVYPGMDVEHWRDKCDGPDGYYSGQGFFHFVLKNGKHTLQAMDKRSSGLYVKNRIASLT